MNQSQNRTERRNLQRVELRKIRTEYKKSMKTFRSKYFDYNPKKFQKTFFYHQFKQESKIKAAVDSAIICEHKEEGASPQNDTDMVSYNYECTSQAEEEQICLLSDHNDKATEVDFIFEEKEEEEEVVPVNELALSDVAESAYVADISEETLSITEYHNRSERRRLQRVELRKVRTEYKQQMKNSCCLDYNPKKFKKTLFYCLFKQASAIVTEDASAYCNYQDTSETDTSDTSTDIPLTSTYQEEGPSTLTNTDTAFRDYECDAAKAPSSDSGTVTVMVAEEVTVAVKDVYNTQDVESFELEWNTLSLISEGMYDGSLDTLGRLQASTDVADSENAELGEKDQDIEDDLNEVHKDNEVGKEEDDDDERPLVSEIDSDFYEKSLKEAAWMLTPPSSIISVICDEKTSLLVTPPQSISEVVFNKPVCVRPSIMGRVEEVAVAPAFRKATFSPVVGIKKKRLRALKKKVGTIVPTIKKVWKRLFN